MKVGFADEFGKFFEVSITPSKPAAAKQQPEPQQQQKPPQRQPEPEARPIREIRRTEFVYERPSYPRMRQRAPRITPTFRKLR